MYSGTMLALMQSMTVMVGVEITYFRPKPHFTSDEEKPELPFLTTTCRSRSSHCFVEEENLPNSHQHRSISFALRLLHFKKCWLLLSYSWLARVTRPLQNTEFLIKFIFKMKLQAQNEASSFSKTIDQQ
jgi:hypothetical protein